MKLVTDMALEARGRTDVGSSLHQLDSLFEQVRLSPAQRRIAQYILADPQETLFLSSSDLARRAGVSQPSVTRLATTLGFRGYTQLRKRLREILTTRGAATDEERPNKFRRAVLREIRNLEALEGALADPSRVQEAGRLIAEASRILVLGLRASSGVASYFAYFASKIHPDVRLMTEGGSVLFDRLLQARSRSACVVAFVLPRYPKEAIEALTFAEELSLRRIVVTDPLGPTTHGDMAFVVHLETHTVFDSHAAPLVLANLLVEAMCDADSDRTERMLNEQEHLMARQRTFWSG
jgi:DNA-binding MurR/RpiR family transcriptional regulator